MLFLWPMSQHQHRTRSAERQSIGRRRNMLLRYKMIMEEFDRHNSSEVPITVIWRKYIYPRFFISRQTLYKIFNTEVDEQLRQVNERGRQLTMF